MGTEMNGRRTFLRGIAGLFVAASLPSTNLLANDRAVSTDAIEFLQEQYVENPQDLGHIVQWLARCGDKVAACSVAVADWNDLQLRDRARAEARLCLRRHFDRKETT